MEDILVIWLWNQWQKYVNYFKKNNYNVFWACKTEKTKKNIENKLKIKILNDYKNLIKNNNFDIIVIALPPSIQGRVSLDILKNWFKNKLIIEIPVCWDETEIKELKKYNNCIFFLEEYYTLLSKFFKKINVKRIKKINIDVITSKEDYLNEKARQVTYIHILNNFLWLNIKKEIIDFNFSFHIWEDIFYKISFKYLWKEIIYNFWEKKFLTIWWKKMIDKYNFDFVLKNIIEEKYNFSKYYFI